MGDAVLDSSPKEVLLCILPFPEPVDLLGALGRTHPDVKIIYRQVPHVKGKVWSPTTIVPDKIYAQATIICTLAALPASPEQIPHVKFIHLFSAGSDHISRHPIYTHSTIPLTTSSGIHGPMISEWVVMQILSHSHRQKTMLEWQKERNWGTHGGMDKLKDAVGMRVGVLGYGSIGRQVACVCKAMGMDIIAYTASPRTTPESKRDDGYIVPGTGDEDGSLPSAWYSGLDKSSLRDFLSQHIDILVISVPLTKQTFHFLGDAEFKILGEKKNAFITNISRGAIIDQTALVKYCKLQLEDGGLRGAALDVTDPEPLPEDHELWGLENVAITPHISGLSAAYESRSFAILDKNLSNLENGKHLINEVRRERGY